MISVLLYGLLRQCGPPMELPRGGLYYMNCGNEASEGAIEPTCSYIFSSANERNERCGGKVHSNGLCILHIALPDENSPEFNAIVAEKKDKLREKLANRDFNFEGARLYDFYTGDFDADHIEHMMGLGLQDAVVKKSVTIINAQMLESILFCGAKIGEDVICQSSTVHWNVGFKDAKIRGSVSFFLSEIGRAYFQNAQIGGDVKCFTFKGALMKIRQKANFSGAKIGGGAIFFGAEIGGDAIFTGAQMEYAEFGETQIGGVANFDNAQIGGDPAGFQESEIKRLSFRNTKFKRPQTQEDACRKAKKIWDGLGDRDEADYYFYREMEAKRGQKKPGFGFGNAFSQRRLKTYLRGYAEYFLEWPVQHITGYWVYPTKVLRAFAIFVLFFGFTFWLIAQNFTLAAFSNSVWYSFLTLFNPIGKIENAQPGLFGAVTIIAGFVGLFTWPVFIATLAKKYGR